MKEKLSTRIKQGVLVAALLLLAFMIKAEAAIDGVTGTDFSFTAKADYLGTADGGSYVFWGYALNGGLPQYPGPTLIVNQGDTVTISLANELDEPVSIVFPGQEGVTATGAPGLLTAEAPAGGNATYTFNAAHPGTYIYQSGSNPGLQIEMGLFGVIVVRPSIGAKHAYNHPDSRFDREHLFLLSEIDPEIHQYVEFGMKNLIDNTKHYDVYWFINGRTAPDVMSEAGAPWLPTQPYNSVPRMHPGERLLMRVVNLGRKVHPFHHHGNHARVIAQDGRLLASGPGTGADLAHFTFTIQSVPGGTVDAIFEWTGKNLGWDIYGSTDVDPAYAHGCNDINGDGFDEITHEYCPDHNKPIPVFLPEKKDLTFGGWWSGSPYLGQLGGLPPGEGGLNPNGAFNFMWHSHTEKELTNFDIFPGGMMTMLFIEPPGVVIP